MCDIDLIYIYIVLVYFVHMHIIHKSTLREILFLKNLQKIVLSKYIRVRTTFVKKKNINIRGVLYFLV